MSWRTWFQRSPHRQEFRPFGFFGFLLLGPVYTTLCGVLFLGWRTCEEWQTFAESTDLVRFWLLGLGTWFAGGVWLGLVLWFGIAWSLRRQLRSSGRDPDLTSDDVERT